MTTATYRKINGRYTIGKVQGSRGKYGIDLTAWLALVGTTATSVTVSGVGVTAESPGTVQSGVVWAWVSGGDPTLGADNHMVMTIQLADGGTEVRSLYFRVTAL